MEVTTGAMRALLPKLTDLLKDEYSLEKHVREGVKSLEIELEMMHAALRKVAEAPLDQLDDQVKIWASKVREISYDMEDAVDAFMVRVEDDSHSGPSTFKNRVKRSVKKISKLFRKAKELHQIVDAIKEAQALAQQMAGLRERYSGLELQNSGMVIATIDPHLTALYIDATDLVGIDHTREELIKTSTEGEDSSKQQLKIISIIGFGGLGKTTLARAVHEKIEAQFDCSAFVSVSRNPDVRMIFKKMLHQLDKVKYANINESSRYETQLIDELREFLQDKRYP
ncbi:disease resistance protein RGA5-like [Oryza glaberrima]|uniref:disease resistance protein RGA5-like n=1 Tax=Oryza glaberrima TaxID=4538 RepID=UPI00023DC5A0|nr:disease resistance protein RGA5-like [Oryza glaberrima]